MLKVLVITALWLCSLPAFSYDTASDRASPTVFLAAEYGFLTYQSKSVESNDDAFGYTYTLGFHASEERRIGILLKNDAATVNFKLNESKIATTFFDTIIRYRWDWLYLGVILGSGTMVLAKEGEELMDATGSGYGGNLGTTIDAGKNKAIFIDVSTVSYSNVRDIEDRSVGFGPRTDVDLGMIFFVTRNAFDIVLGYRYRTLTAKTEDASGQDTSGFTYLGFKLNSFF